MTASPASSWACCFLHFVPHAAVIGADPLTWLAQALLRSKHILHQPLVNRLSQQDVTTQTRDVFKVLKEFNKKKEENAN